MRLNVIARFSIFTFVFLIGSKVAYAYLSSPQEWAMINYPKVIIVSLIEALCLMGVFHFFAGRFIKKIKKNFLGDPNSRLLLNDDNVPSNEWSVIYGSINECIEEVKSSQRNQKTNENKVKTEIANEVKLSTLNDVAATLAHDINNPLQLITLNSKLISRAEGLSEAEHERLEKINKAAYQIKDLMKRMVTSSRRRINYKEGINIYDSIESAKEFLAAKLENTGVSFENRVPMDLTCWGDEEALHKLFVQVLTNSSDAMADADKKQIEVMGNMEEDKIHISIRDFGHGIAEEKIEDLFKPFYTTKEDEVNTGLGLSSCKNIIKLHQGDFEVQSKENEGTTVTITLKTNSPFKNIA